MNDSTAENVQFGADGLIPAIVQDATSGDVLMLAYMNDEALRLTRETSRVHYWSRSRSKLWRKGETSGNEQIVMSITVNCEQNSLLLEVEQQGAVCHDGYATCFYRTLNDDGSLTIVRERVFDPAAVYGRSALPDSTIDQLVAATQLQFAAYCFLRDNDLEEQSTTSRRLRSSISHRGRVADELRELAGVLDGDHVHDDPERDLRLEASQVIYWLLLDVVRNGFDWADVRPDRALATTDFAVSRSTIANLIRLEAATWESPAAQDVGVTAVAHATLALVAQACRGGGIDPLEAVLADLDDLRGRPYLASFFVDKTG